MERYKIFGAGTIFNGLIVHTDGEENNGLHCVRKIEQGSRLFPSFSAPVTRGAMFIAPEFLSEEPCEAEKEDESFPKLGVFCSTTTIERGGFVVTWASYENAISVTVKNEGQTRYAHVFFDEDDPNERKVERLGEFLSDLMYDKSYDMDDVVFDLRKCE